MRETTPGDADRSARDALVQRVARVVIDDPAAVAELEALEEFFVALDTDLDEETCQLAGRALFVAAEQRPAAVAERTDTVRALLGIGEPAI